MHLYLTAMINILCSMKKAELIIKRRKDRVCQYFSKVALDQILLL